MTCTPRFDRPARRRRDGGRGERRPPRAAARRSLEPHRPRDRLVLRAAPAHAASFGARRAEHRAARAADPRRPAPARQRGAVARPERTAHRRRTHPAWLRRPALHTPSRDACSRGHGNVVAEGSGASPRTTARPRGARRQRSAARRCSSSRSIAPLADDASFEARSRWRIIEERTRDQSYRLDPRRLRRRRASPATRRSTRSLRST